MYKVFGYVSAQSFNEAFSRRATKNRWTGKGLRTHLSILVHLGEHSPELVQKNSDILMKVLRNKGFIGLISCGCSSKSKI